MKIEKYFVFIGVDLRLDYAEICQNTKIHMRPNCKYNLKFTIDLQHTYFDINGSNWIRCMFQIW